MWALYVFFVVVIAASHQVNAYSKRHDNVVVICTTQSAGFDMPVDEGGLADDIFDIHWNVPNSTVVDGEDLKGFDVDLRMLLFKGEVDDLTVSTPLSETLHSFPQYEVRWAESFSAALVLTRMGYCDVAFAPFTVTNRRASCNAKLHDHDANKSFNPGVAVCPDVTTCDNSTLTTPEGEACEYGRFGWQHFGYPKDCCVDFAKAYVNTGLSVLYLSSLSAEYETQFINAETLNAFCFLVLSIFVSGHVIWFLEHNHNPDHFPQNYLDGIDDAVWWSAVTVTTVGYGDKVPVTFGGRVFGFFWMFAGLLICGYFTGIMTAQMTAAKLHEGIEGLEDFKSMTVCTTPFYADGHIKDMQLNKLEVMERYTDCVDALEAGDVDAVWFDKPILDYTVDERDKVGIWSTTDEDPHAPIELSVAFPEEPRQEMLHLREELENALARATTDGALSELSSKWFGSIDGNDVNSKTKDDHGELDWPIVIACVSLVGAYLVLQATRLMQTSELREEFIEDLKICGGGNKFHPQEAASSIDTVVQKLTEMELLNQQLMESQKYLVASIKTLAQHSGVKLPDLKMHTSDPPKQNALESLEISGVARDNRNQRHSIARDYTAPVFSS